MAQTPSTYYALGADTAVVIADDLNGDGKLDLITVQWSPTNTFTVLLGNGDGTFNLQTPVSVGSSLSGGAIGDINADGKLDLILSNSTNTLILPGNSDGTFQSPIQLPYASSDAAVGDFNNDGKLDLVLYYTGYLLQEVPVGSASPTNLSFSNQAVGTKSAAQVVTFSNTGSSTLTVTSIEITGVNVGDFAETNTCGSTLAINASCQISVTFAPSAAGSRSATLNIAGNGIGGTTSVTLSGVRYVLPSLSPSPRTFPNQYVGTSGLPQTVMLTNPAGNGAVSISSVTATPSSDFAVVSSCGNSVADGTTCSISVFFDPSVSGTRTGTLTVTDSASNSPQTAALTGTGEDFSMSSGSSSATVSPGQTATYKLTVASGGGFNQTVTLSCSGAPAQSSCSVSPSSMKLSGTASSTATISVTTAASTARLMPPIGIPPNGSTLRLAVLSIGLTMLASWVGLRRNSGRRLVPYGFALLFLLSVGVTMAGCGGGNSSSGGSGGTPAGSYTLSVTGTFNSGATTLTHTTKLTLIVQ